MTPLPNNIVEVESLPKIQELMDHHSKISANNSNSVHNGGGSTTQNGISDEPMDISELNLRCESDRLKTFKNWPVPFMNINDLAAAGFYYINKGDRVRCPYCSIEVGRWVEGDDPLTDHRKHSPRCRYLETGDNHTNVGGYDVCGPFITPPAMKKCILNPPICNAEESGLQKLRIHNNRPPTHPNYTTNEARLSSFACWPVSMKLKPSVLSEAGFFYTGKGDQTICFHCGGGLKDWEDTDDPWVEHARHFSDCNYVLLIKGNEFIDEARGRKTEVSSLTREEMKAVVEKHSEVVFTPTVDNSPSFERTTTADENPHSAEMTEVATSKQSEAGTSEDIATVAVKNDNDNTLCRVCYNEERNAVFLPCGHLVVCGKCSIGLKTCVVCRKPCEARVRVFLS